MRKVKKYLYVEGGIDDIVEKTRLQIRKGWQPWGIPFQAIDVKRKRSLTIYQMVVKYEERYTIRLVGIVLKLVGLK